MKRQSRREAYTLIRSVIFSLHKEIVAEGMMQDRVDALSNEKQKEVALGKKIDGRYPLWVTKSAKGNLKYADSHRNVSLADHSISVMSAAVTFACFWLVDQGCDIDEKMFAQLYSIGLVALLHDLNKLDDDEYQLNDNRVLVVLKKIFERWKLAEKLARYNINLTAEDIFQLINCVEANTAHSGSENQLTNSKLRQRCRTFVRLADQLDGCFHKRGIDGGINGVLSKLAEWNKIDQGYVSSLGEWHHIHIFDSAHPYLLDLLQQQLFKQCLNIAGISPLLSVHHDGALDVLIPQKDKEQIIAETLKNIAKSLLPNDFKISISTTKKPDIIQGQPDWDKLLEHVLFSEENQEEIQALLSIAADDLVFFTEKTVNDCFGLLFGKKASSTKAATLMPIFPNNEENEQIQFYRLTALISLLLRHGSQNKVKLLSEESRLEKITQILSVYGYQLEFLSLKKPLSQSTWLSMQIAGFMLDDEMLFEELLSLLASFYQGYVGEDKTESYAGIKDCLKEDTHNLRVNNVIRRFEYLLNNKAYLPITLNSSEKIQNCLITAEPTQGRIEAKDELYGIKMSQFSTRNGRSADIGDPKGVTMLGPTSYCEYQLRTLRHGNPNEDMPVFISSPSTTGLFPGVRFTDEKHIDEHIFFSTYDLCREDLSKKVLYGPEIFTQRLFLARQESMPNKFKDQLDWLERVVKAVQRTGRPFHIFRGLPTSRPEILYVDCLLPIIKKLCGNKSGFRIEELAALYEKIHFVKAIIEARGNFYLLNAMLTKETEFASLCEIKCLLEDYIAQKESQNKVQGLGMFTQARLIVNSHIKQFKREKKMTKRDNAIFELAQCAARVQKGFGSSASKSEQTLIFNLIMDAVKTHISSRLPMDDALKNAIVDRIDSKVLGNKDKYLGKKDYRDGKDLFNAFKDIADCFVDKIWEPILKSRMPNTQLKRQLIGIYRIEMLNIYESRREEKNSVINNK